MFGVFRDETFAGFRIKNSANSINFSEYIFNFKLNRILSTCFISTLVVFVCIIIPPTYAKTYYIEDFNTVRHHHQQLSRQPRQQRESSSEEKGYCAPYNGKICKTFITHQVWYSREDPTGGWKNEQITTALWEELIGDLTGLCRAAAEVCVSFNLHLKLVECFFYLFFFSRNFFVLMPFQDV